MVLPLVKLGFLAVKQIAKPVAQRLKNQALNSPRWQRALVATGRRLHYNKLQIERIADGKALLKRERAPVLERKQALMDGADFLAEMVIYGVSASILGIEYWTSRKKDLAKAAKEAAKEATTQRLKEANEELQWQEFRQLNLRVAELNGRVAELEAARSEAAGSGGGECWTRSLHKNFQVFVAFSDEHATQFHTSEEPPSRELRLTARENSHHRRGLLGDCRFLACAAVRCGSVLCCWRPRWPLANRCAIAASNRAHAARRPGLGIIARRRARHARARLTAARSRAGLDGAGPMAIRSPNDGPAMATARPPRPRRAAAEDAGGVRRPSSRADVRVACLHGVRRHKGCSINNDDLRTCVRRSCFARRASSRPACMTTGGRRYKPNDDPP